MCGIGGIVRFTPPGGSPAPIPEAWLDALDRRMAHRGPDGSGRYADTSHGPDGSVVHAALVHRRLAVIDRETGHQPAVSARGPGGAGAVAVVFNGCLYNHRALRAELAPAGHRFATDHSDTEVLVHGWRAWGPTLAEHLDGMYAAAIWDHDAARCVVMRDRAGEKPLYYSVCEAGRCLVFCSSVRGVVDARRSIEPGWSPDLDGDAMLDWLRFGWSARTPYRDIHELPPRCTAVFDPRSGAPDLRIAHTVALPERRAGAGAITVDAMDRMVAESVESRLEADVPLACFLSGGIDSSLIAHYAKQRLGRLTTICVRLPVASYDESPFAGEVARAIGSDHRVIDAHTDAAPDLVRLIDTLGLPFGDSSILPTYWASRAAREHATVVLGGDGGDELCFGYRRHRAGLMLRRARALVALTPHRWPRALTRGRGTVSECARLAETIASQGYRAMVSWPIADIDRVAPAAAARLRRSTPALPDPARDDFGAYLPLDILRKSDTASMMVPVEVRAPLLSNQMINRCLAEPVRGLMRGGESKGILRALARRHLPPSIANRPKHGFGVPVGAFFRSNVGGMRTLIHDALHSADPFGPAAPALGLDTTPARNMLADHADGRRDFDEALFGLLTLSLWATSLR
jgi:asparagine synthase (glutamine-hydrolysing)